MKRSLNTYVWGPGFNRPSIAEPQEIGTYLEGFGAELTVDAILHDANKSKSPLHKLFTWDDTKASDQFRRYEARQLLNHVYIEKKGELSRAFFSVGVNRTRKYVHTAQVPEYVIVEKGEKEIRAWIKRYRGVKKLAPLVNAVSALILPPVSKKKYA